jgi:hypothetical protein
MIKPQLLLVLQLQLVPLRLEHPGHGVVGLNALGALTWHLPAGWLAPCW